MFRIKIARSGRLVLLISMLALVSGAAVFSIADEPRPVPAITQEMVDSMKMLPGGLAALPQVHVPADNPLTAEKVELGKRLFFDTRLSLDRNSSCATCHAPEKAYADGLVRAKGF